MKDYSELTSKIYVQLSPELSQEFHNMLTDMAKEISRLYEIENAKPSEALEELTDIIQNKLSYSWGYSEESIKLIATIKQALLKAQEQEKVLNIIKEKRVDIESFYTTFIEDDYDYNFYEKRYGTYGLECLTEEEFELLKRMC